MFLKAPGLNTGNFSVYMNKNLCQSELLNKMLKTAKKRPAAIEQPVCIVCLCLLTCYAELAHCVAISAFDNQEVVASSKVGNGDSL